MALPFPDRRSQGVNGGASAVESVLPSTRIGSYLLVEEQAWRINEDGGSNEKSRFRAEDGVIINLIFAHNTLKITGHVLCT